jgi:hypothetical protein
MHMIKNYIRLLLRTTKKIIWANDEWLTTPENIENFPLFSPKTLILVHPTALLSILYLLPSIRPTSQKEVQNEESDVDKWSAITQLYMSLILRTILRSERNQQIMCKYDMPKAIMDVGLNLFTIESGHPLLSSFNYMLERLSCQSLRPAELRFIVYAFLYIYKVKFKVGFFVLTSLFAV